MSQIKSGLFSLLVAAGLIGGGYFIYDNKLDAQYAYAQGQQAEAQKSLANLQDLSNVFKTVSRAVEPAVVSIQVHKKVTSQLPNIRQYFRIPEDGRTPDSRMPDLPDLRIVPELPDEGDALDTIGTGSGVLVEITDGKGYILTNNHVVSGGSEMTITLNDGRQVSNGKILATDPRSDLAVVTIEADRLFTAKWGNSDDLQKGDWVMAFGSPFGYVGSMTHGIVSGMNRQTGIIGGQGYENFIQVDAPINPGNSGGPLVDIHGNIVGINTAIASESGGFQGIGFAIPSNQAKFVYQSLKEHGKVVRGWIGVSISDVTSDPKLAESFEYKDTKGVIVQQVLPDTPAYGILKIGDIITQFNGKKIESMQQFRNLVAQTTPGAEVKLMVFRDKKESEIALKLGEQKEQQVSSNTRNNPVEKAAPTSALGIETTTLTEELAKRNGLSIKEGVLVSNVRANSPAARAQIRKGDVITQVGKTPVKNQEDFDAAMKQEDLKKGIRLYVESTDGGRFVMITVR